MPWPWGSSWIANKLPSSQEDMMLNSFCNLRQDVIDIEEILGSPGSEWSEKDLKRLDKAITVIKVGMKIAKLVLRRHGARTSIAKKQERQPRRERPWASSPRQTLFDRWLAAGQPLTIMRWHTGDHHVPTPSESLRPGHARADPL